MLFVMAALVTVCVVSLLQRLSLTKELQQLLVESSLFFFAAIMLTEPLTAPPTQKLKRIYAVITGILFIPQIHIGPIYSTVVRNLPFYGHEVHIWYPVPASTRTAWYPRAYILSTGVCLSAQLAVGATLAC